MRTILNLEQGSEEWKQARLNYFCASEAPAVMGVHKYMSRTELLDLKKSGVSKPVSPNQKSIFNRGHEAEEKARELMEIQTLDEFPAIVFSNESFGIPLLASLDGFNDSSNTVWEHKLWNKTLVENVRLEKLEDHYIWQLEHQMLVSETDFCIFTCSDGTAEKKESFIYHSKQENKDKLIKAWKQFSIDLENHVIQAKTEKIDPIISDSQLPAIIFAIDGSDITSNIQECLSETKLLAEAEKSKELNTDLDFANKDQFNKNVKKARKTLKDTVIKVQNRFVSFAEFSDMAKDLDSVLQKLQSSGEKQVKEAKEAKKRELIEKGEQALAGFIYEKDLLIKPYTLLQIIGTPSLDFVSAIKGKRTIDSINEAITQLITDKKLDLNSIYDRIIDNLMYLNQDPEAMKHKFLFNDSHLLLNKVPEDLKAVIKTRISDYKSQQEKIEAEKKEVQRKFDEEVSDLTSIVDTGENLDSFQKTLSQKLTGQSNLFDERQVFAPYTITVDKELSDTINDLISFDLIPPKYAEILSKCFKITDK